MPARQLQVMYRSNGADCLQLVRSLDDGVSLAVRLERTKGALGCILVDQDGRLACDLIDWDRRLSLARKG
jgi:hypothetical protein